MKKIILTALSFMLLSFPYSSNAKVYTQKDIIKGFINLPPM